MDKHGLSRFSDSLKTPVGWMGYKYDSSFVSFAKVIFITPKKITVKEGDSFTIPCTVQMPEQYKTFIRNHSTLSDSTRIGIFNKKGWQKDISTTLSLRKIVDENKFDLTINPELMKGKYYLRFSIQSGFYNSTHNSDKIELVVE
jgi:hypothetical protein